MLILFLLLTYLIQTEASELYRQCVTLCHYFHKKFSDVEKQAMYELAKCLIETECPIRGLAVLDKAIINAETRYISVLTPMFLINIPMF
jgi:hypothetical protein